MIPCKHKTTIIAESFVADIASLYHIAIPAGSPVTFRTQIDLVAILAEILVTTATQSKGDTLLTKTSFVAPLTKVDKTIGLIIATIWLSAFRAHEIDHAVMAVPSVHMI